MNTIEINGFKLIKNNMFINYIEFVLFIYLFSYLNYRAPNKGTHF